MEAIAPALYVLIKAIAYMSWCGLGARLQGHRGRLWLKGIFYGLVRLAMGALLGLLLIFWLVRALSTVIPNHLLLYLAVYVPVRWLEWSMLEVFMDLKPATLHHLILGDSSSSRLWRLGGIVISCLADIPMMVALGGLPLGRFMC